MKNVSRIFIFVLVLVVALFSVSYDALAAERMGYLPETYASEPELVETQLERMEFANSHLNDHELASNLAERAARWVDRFGSIDDISANIEVDALTQQQVQNFDCATITDVPVIECEALVALYSSTNGAGWGDRTNWLVTATVGDWYGVTVNNGNISLLDLSYNQLSGSIPPVLGNLNNLVSLILDFNQLSGTIPSELGHMTNIQNLFLTANQLNGGIPPELGSLTNIRLLYLSNNKLSGSIPPELGNLTSLQSLRLGSNQLSGKIPAELGNLTNLKSLEMSWNQLNDTIPPELGNMANLQYLYLYKNQLSGSIPPELRNLTALQYLDLSYNQLSGEIPAEIGNLTNLQQLYLFNNNLSGSIPPELGNLINLVGLNLSSNHLTGSIPAELGSLTSLGGLYLSSNQLTGSIPAELGSLTSLGGLYLSSNQLTGSIPAELGKLINLGGLYLSSNQLTGNIPAELGSLINLVKLSLAGNKLDGSIPTAIGNLVALNHLDLSDNMLSGNVPDSFTNLVNLCDPGNLDPPCYGYYQLDLGYNRLNVPATEPPASFLAIKDPDWYLTQAVEADIPGETGGTVISNDGNTEIAIPPDAVEGLLTVLFAPQPGPSEDIGTLNLAGNSFELTASIGEDPVTSFAEPLTLTLHYDEASLGVIPEDSLILYYWDTDMLAWVDAASTCAGGIYTRNLDENWLSLPICHLSEFVLLGDSFDLFLPTIRR